MRLLLAVLIIFPDADPAQAAKAAMKGMNNMNRQGRSYSSTSRVFAHESLHGTVQDALVAEGRGAAGGAALRGRQRGRRHRIRRQFEWVTSFIASGREEGRGSPPAGGHSAARVRRSRPDSSSAPVFDGVDNSMHIARDEIIGPVMSVLG